MKRHPASASAAAAALLCLLTLLVVLVPGPAPAAEGDSPEIRGRAVDAQGAPVPGATVALVDVSASDPLSDPEPGQASHGATAGEDGTFVLPAASVRSDRYVLAVCLSGATQWDRCSRDDGDLELLPTYVGTDGPHSNLLAVGGYFGGAESTAPIDLGDVRLEEPSVLRVVMGSTAAEAVYITALGSPSGFGLSEPVVDGVATFASIRPGGYQLQAIWPFGYSLSGHPTVRVGPGVTTVDLSGADPTVSGTVRVDGEAVADVPVTLVYQNPARPHDIWAQSRYSMRTDAAGRYAFVGVAPSSSPYLVRFGRQSGRLDDDGPVPYARQVLVEDRDADERFDLDVRSSRLGAVTGSVPFRAPRVRLHDASGALIGLRGTSAPRRRFAVPRLLPGTYLLEAQGEPTESGVTRFAHRRFEVRPGRTTRLGVLKAAPRTGSVTVRAPRGTTVQIEGGAPPWAEQPRTQHRRVSGRPVTFRHLIPGTYRVALTSDLSSRLLPPAREVRVGRGETRVRLRSGQPAGSLRGLLVDARTDLPWPWQDGFAHIVCAAATDGREYRAPVVRSPDGPRFKLATMRPGRYTCRVDISALPWHTLPYHLTIAEQYDVRGDAITEVRMPVGLTSG
ncbi:carboxypeptidase-like regulatory domain-containing protein [Nocardioides sp. SOB77]|uniref:Carboxypeptidase-like regulatory domain-containing protein n=1 Tax=Nocardioides oceani TaxID=3058369 RepID=A0ABT8FHH2_9ACTN|nr:carboxypeptidase-like regulatory domain-containing protein [Nocardioides oceani]MDN4174127.1 carboxypeptidase-like regulatory domain-containing protein [Nocardioides oceani]